MLDAKSGTLDGCTTVKEGVRSSTFALATLYC